MLSPKFWAKFLPCPVTHVHFSNKVHRKEISRENLICIKRTENSAAGVPFVARWLTDLTGNHGVVGSVPGLAQWVKDLVLLWLWHRPVATARPLAWEPPCATGAALERTKRPKKERKRKKKKTLLLAENACKLDEAHGQRVS